MYKRTEKDMPDFDEPKKYCMDRFVNREKNPIPVSFSQFKSTNDSEGDKAKQFIKLQEQEFMIDILRKLYDKKLVLPIGKKEIICNNYTRRYNFFSESVASNKIPESTIFRKNDNTRYKLLYAMLSFDQKTALVDFLTTLDIMGAIVNENTLSDDKHVQFFPAVEQKEDNERINHLVEKSKKEINDKLKSDSELFNQSKKDINKN